MRKELRNHLAYKIISGTGLLEKMIDKSGYDRAMDQLKLYCGLIDKGRKDTALIIIARDIEIYLFSND